MKRTQVEGLAAPKPDPQTPKGPAAAPPVRSPRVCTAGTYDTRHLCLHAGILSTQLRCVEIEITGAGRPQPQWIRGLVLQFVLQALARPSTKPSCVCHCRPSRVSGVFRVPSRMPRQAHTSILSPQPPGHRSGISLGPRQAHTVVCSGASRGPQQAPTSILSPQPPGHRWIHLVAA